VRTKVLFLGLFLALLVPANADIMRIYATTGAKYGGEYISPYRAQIQNGSTWGPDFWVACLDLGKVTYEGQPYTYDVTTDSPTDRLTKAAALLMGQVIADYNVWHLTGASTDLKTLGIASFAIWDLWDDNDVHAKLSSADYTAAVNLAHTALDAVDHGAGVPDYKVYTPTGNSQRYISLVPDGGMTLMLLGGVLVGLETLRRKLAA